MNTRRLYEQFGFAVVDDRFMVYSPNPSESHPAGHVDPSLITYSS